jgi:glycosyltransferase involved in cell wall biosynthesis
MGECPFIRDIDDWKIVPIHLEFLDFLSITIRINMRILSVHNRYLIRGGEDESREAEENLLRQMGHQVDVYEEDNKTLASLNKVQALTRTIWSQSSYRKIREQLNQAQYDIVHIQNFFPIISPSAHYAAQAAGVPVVQSLRNYRLLCPNALFFRDNQVCEDCLGKKIPYPGVLHRCYRESLPASVGVTAMLTTHRLLKTWTRKVNVYIALTNFAREKYIQGGLPPEKIVVKPNFVSPDPGVGSGNGRYALYVGRLSVEKGLDTLLAAWKQLDGKLPLKIVGDGPLADEVKFAAQSLVDVEWLGIKSMSEVHTLMGNATVLIFPSKWYETFGRVAVEAFAKGTPVIGANIGALQGLIDSGRTGLHFQPGDPEDLASKVSWLVDHPETLKKMRLEVRAEFENKYTAQINYKMLINIYLNAIENQKNLDMIRCK